MNLLNTLLKTLEGNDLFIFEGKLLKNKIIESALKLDPVLITILFAQTDLKKVFFAQLDTGIAVFDKDKFIKFVSNKSFLPDSYTSFKNKIGLMSNDEYIKAKEDVVLAWPYKDCVLEGGQSRDDVKSNEVFWNDILATDTIDRLLDPKVLTSFVGLDKNGEHKIDQVDPSDNLLIKGNNLLALHSLKKRFDRLDKKIKLIYIDPPYNTGGDSFLYNDSFNHASWLTFMKNRLEVAKDLLSNDGVIWINLDDNEAHYCKVLCDEIFGRENFVANIIWQKKYSPANDAKWFSDNHDHILVYAKNKSDFQPNLLPRTAEMNERYKNPDNDERGDWKPGGFSVKTYSASYDYPITTPSGKVVYPPAGSCWQTSYENYERLLQDNRIWFGKNGDSKPQLKQFLSEVQQGVVAKTIWTHDEVGHNQLSRAEITALFGDFAFSTPKPEKLMKRIIELSTKEGDIVCDFFCGSGTTIAVAHKMKRQYIGIEQMDYIYTVTKERQRKVIEGEQGGVSQEVNWIGGGSFVFAEMLEMNMQFLHQIQLATTSEDLLRIFERIKQHAVLNYKLNIDQFVELQNDFLLLSLADQKKMLSKMVDKNQLYINYSEIDDYNTEISESMKKLNKDFYGF